MSSERMGAPGGERWEGFLPPVGWGRVSRMQTSGRTGEGLLLRSWEENQCDRAKGQGKGKTGRRS